jgi:chromosomal replication initiation ATPase DnaA
MKNVTSKKQLFLDFGRDYDARLVNFFFSKPNEIIKNEIHQLMQSDDKSDLFIYGDKETGKTFLLNSILNDTHNNSQTIYIDLAKLNEDKDYFSDFENFDLICLDNLDSLNQSLQIQMFNLINACKASGTSLIFASGMPISELKVFPDLHSRLKEISFFALKCLDGDEALECLNFLAQKLDLHIQADALELIAKKIKRDFLSIKQSLIDFDKYLYSEKKQPTKMSAASFLKIYLD